MVVRKPTRDKRYIRKYRRRYGFERPDKPRKTLARNVVIMGLLGVLVALSGIWFFFGPLGRSSEPGEEPVEFDHDISAAGFDFIVDKEERNILHLKPPFIVNLAGMDGKYVMKVKIWLEVDTLEVAAELNEDSSKFRRMTDDILRTIKGWTYAELCYGNGIERLKDQLQMHVNRYLTRGRIIKVIFPEIKFATVLPKPETPGD